MSPVALLAGFCCVMVILSVVDLALSERRDPIDVGTTLLVVGITAFVFVWLDLEMEWSPTGVGPLLIAVGVITIAVGVTMVVTDW